MSDAQVNRTVTISQARRAALMGGTALVALFGGSLVTSTVALAQSSAATRAASLPANALPSGGKVVAGSASIATSGTTMNVTQSTNNASVNWRSFDVGTAGTVNFTAPSPQSVTINQVRGPDPSVIAGKINANDQLVLINQSGVLFTKGAEVNTQSLVVSAAGITEANMKAGKLILSEPGKPNAAVVNQGKITVAKTGLAALVAPQVANSGVIEAKMGHVVLAGAAAATVDLYGDGLMSIDVTKQVTTAPLGPNGQPVQALVTNTGTIRADGGTVVLTAQAAEGIVTNLVLASGKISANTTASGKTGTVAINATGGDVAVTGHVSAQGKKAGTTGGQIEINATGQVGVGSAATINASGKAGGGTVAIGTTLARAKGGAAVAAPVATKALIAPGAKIAADATVKGKGGTVAVLSSANTYQGGSISAVGGPKGGNGGSVEISSQGGFSLTGPVNVGAAAGKPGSILIDPFDLAIEADTTTTNNNSLVVTSGSPLGLAFNSPDQTSNAVITPSSFNTLTGDVTLQATHNLTVDTPFTYLSSNLYLQAGNNLTVTSAGSIAPGTVTANGSTVTGGNLYLQAATQAITTIYPAGALSINGSVSAGASSLSLYAGTGGIQIGANVSAHIIAMQSAGDVVQSSGTISTPANGAVLGTIEAIPLSSGSGLGGNILLNQSGNAFGVATGLFTTSGTVALANGTDLTLTGAIGNSGTAPVLVSVAGGHTLTLGDVATGGTASLITPVSITTNGGTISLQTDTLVNGSTLNAISGQFNTASVIEIAPTTTSLGVYTGDGTPTNSSLSLSSALLQATTITTLRLGEVQGTITAAGIQIGQQPSTYAFPTLDVQTGGALIQDAAGVLTANKLTGSVGSVPNTLSASVSNLGSFTVASGAFTLNDATSNIVVSGPVSASSVAISAASNVNSDAGYLSAIEVAGSITATAGTITLKALDDGGSLGASIATPILIDATGQLKASAVSLNSLSTDIVSTGRTPYAVFETSGGVISTSALSASVGSGTVDLRGAGVASGNTIGSIGVVSGTTLPLFAVATTGTLNLAGNIAASIVDLSSAGNLTQTSGTLSAGTLQSSYGVGGSENITLSGNQISRLSSTAVTGNLSVRSDVNMAVGAATVSAANAFLEVGKAGGTLTVNPAVSLPSTGTLSLQADHLVLTNGSTITLLEMAPFSPIPISTVAAVGNTLDLSGDLTGVNAGTLHLGGIGSTTTATGITLGTLNLSGGGNSVALLNLTTGGNITQTGPLAVAGLVGSATGSIALTNTGNAIAKIAAGGLTAGGGIQLADATLSVAGPASLTGAGTISIASNSFSFATGGSLAANMVELGPLTTAVVQIGTAGTTGIDPGDLSKITAGLIRLGQTGLNANKASSISQLSNVTIAAGNTLELDSAGAVTQSAGILQGGLVTGTSGGAFLLADANTLASVGPVSAGGAIAVSNASSLAVVGNLSALADTSIALSAPALSLAAGTTALVPNTAGGGLITILANTLSGAGAISNAGGVVALSPYTNLGTLTLGGGGLSVGNIATPTLRLGSLDGTTISAGAINIASTPGLLPTTNLALFSTGAVSESNNAVLTASALSGKVGSLSLTDANIIATAGSITATTGGIAITDVGALTLAGPVVTATGQTLVLNAATVNVTGNIANTLQALNGTIELIADGLPLPSSPIAGLFNAGTGLLAILPHTSGTAMNFGSSSGLLAGGVLVAGTVEVGGIGGVAQASSLTLGGLSVAGNLILDSQGGISQSALAGSALAITGGTLSVNAGGAVALTNAANSVGPIGNVTVGNSGTFSLTDTLQPVFNGTVNATAVSIISSSAAGIGEGTGGAIVTSSLTASAPTATATIDLSTGSNTISGVGAVTAGMSFLLADTVNPNITGPVTAPTVSLSNTGTGGITIGGSVAASTALSLVAAGGTISEGSTGVLNVGTLSGSLAGSGAVSLVGAGSNSVAAISSFTDTGGSFALTDTAALVLGAVSAGRISVTDAASIQIVGVSSAASGISLITNGITYASGSLGSTTQVEIAPDGNAVETLGVGAGLVVGQSVLGAINTPLLRIGSAGGTVSATTVNVLGSASINAGTALEIDAQTVVNIGSGATTGSLSAPVSVALLVPAGTVSETVGSVLSTPLLTGTSTGASLAGSANVIGALGNFTAGSGTLLLRDTGALAVSGVVTAGTLDLSTTGAINQTGGTITIGTLQSTSGVSGNVTLAQANDSIQTLGNFNDGTAVFTLNDSRALALAGAIAAGTLDLGVAGSLTQSGGSVTAGLLQSSQGITGSVTLQQTANAITTLGTLQLSNGSLLLVDGSALTVAGPVSALQAVSISAAGNLAVPGNVTASGQSLTLTSGGSLSQSGTLSAAQITLNEQGSAAAGMTLSGRILGSTGVALNSTAAPITETTGAVISTPLLTGTVVGGPVVSLVSAANTISNVGAFSAPGSSFSLVDTVNPNVAGAVSAATISLANNGTGGVTVTGTLAGTTSVSLSTVGGGISESSGTITTPLLFSASGIGGSAVLTGPANAITNLGSMTITGGGLQLVDAAALTVSGPVVSAQAVTLNVTGNLALPGNITASGQALTATSTGSISQTGTLSAAQITLTDTGSSAASVTLSGTMLGSTGVALNSTAAPITETAGAVISTPLLTGTVSGGPAVSLVSASNTISGVGAFSAPGSSFSLVDTVNPNVSGTVSAAAISLANNGSGGVTVTGTLAGTTSVSLSTVGGGISESSGTITTPLLFSASGIGGSAVLTGPANAITNLGSMTITAGGLQFVDATALTVSGPVSSAQAVTLNVTGNLSVPGNITASGQALTLTSTGSLTQGGTLSAANVTLNENGPASASMALNGTILGSVDVALNSVAASIIEGAGAVISTPLLAGLVQGGAAVSLTSASNVVSGVTSFSDPGGNFALVDTVNPNVSGPLSAAAISISNSGSTGISVTGTIAGTTSVSLSTVAGGVNESSGTITTPLLFSASGIGGSAVLTGPANAITNLGSMAITGGGLQLVDATALTVGGPVSATQAVTLNVIGDLTLPGNITATGQALTLTSTGSITQSGTLSAAQLTLNENGSASALMALNGTILGSADVALNSTAAPITEGAGAVISTPLLVGAVQGGAAVSLVSASNTISGVGAFSVPGGNFTLADTVNPNISGPLSGAAITISNSGTTGISVTGTIAGSSSVSLSTAGGGISESTGTIVTPLLYSANGINGTVTLTSTGNSIPLLGNVAVTNGGLTLTDSVPLSITGQVSVTQGLSINVLGDFSVPGNISTPGQNLSLSSTGSLSQSGTLSAGVVTLIENGPASASMSLAGTIIGSSGVVLNSTAAPVTEAAGAVIATPLLSGTVGGGAAVSLVSTTNTISGVGAFSAPGGSFALVDTVNPNVSGAVSAAAISLANSGTDGISVTGTLAGTTSVSLSTAGGGIGESRGTITTPLLFSASGIGGSVDLTGPANAITNLGSLAISNGFLSLVDTQGLTVAGPVSVSQAVALNVAGNLVFAGDLSAPGANLTLTSAGAITQTGGVITAGTLSAAGTSISLSTNNQIATEATLTSLGAVILTDAAPLVVTGPISGGSVLLTTTGTGTPIKINGPVNGTSFVTINSVGSVDLAGSVSTQGTLSVSTASGGVAQSSGTVTAATLASPGGIAGPVALTSTGNRIATLGSAVVGGAFQLVDTGALLVAGPVRASSIGLSTTGAITFAGNVSANLLDIATTSGGVNQTGGSLLVGSLAASRGVNGGVTFGSATNQVANLSGLTNGFFASNGGVVLVDATSLSMPGTVSAPSLSVTSAGSITLPGTITVPGTLSLNAGGTIVRPSNAGAFTAGVLQGNAVTLADFGTASRISQLGSFVVTGSTLDINNAIPLSITGPVSAEYLAITATGTIGVSGTITTTGLPLAVQVASTLPMAPGSYLAVTQGTDGSLPSIQQTGTLLVRPSTGAAAANLRLDLPTTGGTITLNDLEGPQANLVLFTRTGGTATGIVNVANLTVVGSQKSASLFGTVANRGGQQAAGLATIFNFPTVQPKPQSDYRLNGCPIGSVNCVLLPLGFLPAANPLHDFVLNAGVGYGGESDLALPDVSSRDY